MASEAFVYLLLNLDNSKGYLGYHKGIPDDNYLCSSLNSDFWEDLEAPNTLWVRVILFEGTMEEAQLEEIRRLREGGLGSHSYNLNIAGAISYTEEVREKMSVAAKANYGASKEAMLAGQKQWKINNREIMLEHTKAAGKLGGDITGAKLSKAVRNIDTGEVFKSQSEAARFYGSNQANLSRALRGNTTRKKWQGCSWEFC